MTAEAFRVRPLGCGSTKRNGVDIAAEADYLAGYDIYENYGNPSGPRGWYRNGGSSRSSPLVAAISALAGGAVSGTPG